VRLVQETITGLTTLRSRGYCDRSRMSDGAWGSVIRAFPEGTGFDHSPPPFFPKYLIFNPRSDCIDCSRRVGGTGLLETAGSGRSWHPVGSSVGLDELSLSPDFHYFQIAESENSLNIDHISELIGARHFGQLS